jgi:hypothetical protein
MKVICVFIVFNVSSIYFGDKFLHRGDQKKSEKIGEIPQTFESKKLEKKLLMTIPFLAPR